MKKRIALSVVTALGAGLLIAAPASAVTSITGTTSFTLNTASYTVVGGNATDYAVFQVTTKDNAGVERGLIGGAQLNVRVVSAPTSVDSTTSASDILFDTATVTTSVANYRSTGDVDTVSAVVAHPTTMTIDSATAGTAYSNYGASTLGVSTSSGTATNNTNGTAAATLPTEYTGTYLIKVKHAANKALDKGFYGLEFNLLDGSGNVLQRSAASVKFVTAAMDSGASITLAVGGTQIADTTTVSNTTRYIKATLRDANGGLVRTDSNSIPSLTSTLYDADSTHSAALTFTDAQEARGTAASATLANHTALDGIYLVGTQVALTSWVAGAGSVVARYGIAAATAAVTIDGISTANVDSSTVVVSATGIGVLDTDPFDVPLSTKTISYTVTAKAAGTGAVVANLPISMTVAYSGLRNTGDVAPASSATTTVYTDSLGKATFSVTNANPIDGAQAVASFSGFATEAVKTATVVWQDASVAALVTTPANSFYAVKGATTKITVTALDTFGNPVANEVIQPSLSSTSDNYSTTALATIKTNAAGQAVFSLADSVATADTTDAVTFTASSAAVSSSAITVTYKTALPVIASLTGYYNLADNSAAQTTPLPVAGIYADAAGTKLAIAQDVDHSVAQATSASTTDGVVKFKFVAKDSASAVVTGVPVVVTASTGAYLLDPATSLEKSSLTIYPNADGLVTFVGGTTKAGNSTFTATAGAVSAAATVVAANQTADARFVTVSAAAATAVAKGDPVIVTALVTDRFGNPVEGVAVNVAASGVGTFNGGATMVSYTTGAEGNFTFPASGTAAGTGTYTVTATTAAKFASVAGYSGATAIDSTVAAGNKTASASINFSAAAASTSASTADVAAAKAAADAATAAAQAAAAAAAKAGTDAVAAAAAASAAAAKAGTDAVAAAAAAGAKADAATAASKAASDAVAALSTSVAGLQTTVASLVASMTAQIKVINASMLKIAKKLGVKI